MVLTGAFLNHRWTRINTDLKLVLNGIVAGLARVQARYCAASRSLATPATDPAKGEPKTLRVTMSASECKATIAETVQSHRIVLVDLDSAIANQQGRAGQRLDFVMKRPAEPNLVDCRLLAVL